MMFTTGGMGANLKFKILDTIEINLKLRNKPTRVISILMESIQATASAVIVTSEGIKATPLAEVSEKLAILTIYLTGLTHH